MNASSPRKGVLLCEECGQRTVVDGPLSAWRSGNILFRCGCGELSVRAGRPQGQGTGERVASRTLRDLEHPRPGPRAL